MHIYSSSDLVQGFVYEETTYLYVRNLQGDVIAIVNECGEKITDISYDIWGGNVLYTAPLEHWALMQRFQQLSPFTYRNYCYDNEIGLYYLQSRYYSPEIHRFINSDDINTCISSVGDVLANNLFTYCKADPINNTDESGYYSKLAAWRYALKWWNDYNPAYKHNGGDCANFVSQCLYAGKLSPMTLTWYSKSFNVTNNWQKAHNLSKWLVSAKHVLKSFTVTTLKQLNVIGKYMYDNFYTSGSFVVFFDYENDGKYDHVVLSGEIQWFKVNKQKEYHIWYFAHTAARSGQMVFEKNGQYWYNEHDLQFVKSNYPKVKFLFIILK